MKPTVTRCSNGVAGDAVAQDGLAVLAAARPLEELADLLLGGAVEDRRREAPARAPCRPSPRCVSRIWPTFMRLGTPSGLRTISTGRAVLEERHLLVRQHHRDHALVAVAAGHLVADLQLALHGDVDLDLLDHARRQLVAGREQLDPLVVELLEHLDLRLRLVDQQADPLAHGRRRRAAGRAARRGSARRPPLRGELAALLGQHLAAAGRGRPRR